MSRDHQSQIEDLNATLTSKIEDLEGQMSDLQNNLTAQQTQIDSLNASILELQDRVETLESLSGFPTPDYDSGWTPIANIQTLTFTHNLGTTELLVYVIGKDSVGDPLIAPMGVHQVFYGSANIDPWHACEKESHF